MPETHPQPYGNRRPGGSDPLKPAAGLSRWSLKRQAGNLWSQAFVLLAVCLCSFFVHLGVHDVDLMEARNFVAAREMADQGHWLVPTMNGEIRIAKPPLPTWVTAVARMAGGNVDNPGVMRLPAAMAATLMVFALWGMMRRLSSDAWLPLIAALILATSLLVIDMGRRGSWDIFSHSFMTAGIWALLAGLKNDQRTYGRFALAGILFALSFMSKGPVSFYALLLPFLIAFIWTSGWRESRQKWRELCLALGLTVVLSAIWPVLIYLHQPEVMTHVFGEETEAWANRHTQPFYFYAHFAVYAGIWAPGIFAGLMPPYAARKTKPFGSYGWVIIWLVSSLILLSVVPEKKERYLLPAMIPMAVLAGFLWRSLFQSSAAGRLTAGDRRWMAAQAAAGSLLGLLVPVMMVYYGAGAQGMPKGVAVLWGVLFLSLSGVLWIMYQKRSGAGIFIASLIAVCLISSSVLPVYYRSPLYRRHPRESVLQEIRLIPSLRGLRYFSIGSLNIKRIWDVGQEVSPWDPEREPVPVNGRPIVLISRSNPKTSIPPQSLDGIDVRILKIYSYDPEKPDAVYYLAILSPLGG